MCPDEPPLSPRSLFPQTLVDFAFLWQDAQEYWLCCQDDPHYGVQPGFCSQLHRRLALLQGASDINSDSLHLGDLGIGMKRSNTTNDNNTTLSSRDQGLRIDIDNDLIERPDSDMSTDRDGRSSSGLGPVHMGRRIRPGIGAALKARLPFDVGLKVQRWVQIEFLFLFFSFLPSPVEVPP